MLNRWIPCIVMAAAISMPAVVAAQDATPPTTPPADPPTAEPEAKPEAKPELGPAGKAFDVLVKQYQELVGQIKTIQAEYQQTKPEDRPALEKKFEGIVSQLKELDPKMTKAAEAAFNEDVKNAEAAQFMVSTVYALINEDKYDEANKISADMIAKGSEVPGLYDLAGIGAFSTHQFDKAAEYLAKAQKQEAISPDGSGMLRQVEDYKKFWKAEQELRVKEAKANDLPRVKLETDKGNIVIELFENEAPETVGNIISLVEKGFYDGIGFHRVLPKFMAQGGCPKGDGMGGPGYNIYCEVDKPNARKHFAGSLSMAKAKPKNTGGSQFFLTFIPTYHLNGQHTVFGRVIEGMDVLPKITRRDPQPVPPNVPEEVRKRYEASLPTPVKIKKATVLRKRDHEYKPNKVKDETAPTKPAPEK